MKERQKGETLLTLIPLLYLIIAVGIVVVVCLNGTYPSGSDTMYHIYRGDWLYQSIKQGDWYPLYNPMWYNGVELLRYWAPLPAYFMAFCQFLAGGNVLDGYLIYVGMIFFLGALSWFYIGKERHRPWLGAFIGVLWFFMPNNLLALFVEGNLARSLCMILLPLFADAVYRYLELHTWKRFVGISVLFALMALCHLGYAGMIALAYILFLLIYGKAYGGEKHILAIFVSIIGGFLVLGVWLYPSLQGGITSLDNTENMRMFFQKLSISLNPFERYESNNSNFYYGLAAFLFAAFGCVCGRRKSAAGLWTAILILFMSTELLYPVMAILPGSQYLWMLRFFSIALCFILFSLLLWETLKKPWIILACLLLVLDTIPSLSLVYGNQSGVLVEERIDELQDATLIAKAQEITTQRLALMDVSSLGSMGAWLVSDWKEPVAGTFGAGWEAANTSTNISQINRALAEGNYLYLFDRCLELGNDSIIIKLSEMKNFTKTIEDLDVAAEKVGYCLVDENEKYRLYHYDVEGNWGTVTSYPAIAIGTQAPAMARAFPAMEEVTSTNLNDFTFEELSKYKLIYLAGFTYDDRAYAESLILRLSEAGVRIVIAADGIPEDLRTHDQSFLGVVCNTISFSNGYPELDTRNGLLNTDLFPEGYEEWKTVYLEGLDDCWGKLEDNGFLLEFYGTVKNENIVMIGLNLSFHYGLTLDAAVGELLSYAFDLSANTVPAREVVPLEITYGSDFIEVISEQEHVNTTLAYHDIFHSENTLTQRNHLTYVDAGITRIRLQYPYLWEGVAVSTIGVLLIVAHCYIIFFRTKKKGRKR